MSQTLTVPTLRPIATPKVFIHLITLINRQTEHEVGLTIETFSDRFSDVMREVSHQRAMLGLRGYDIHEIIDCQAPF